MPSLVQADPWGKVVQKGSPKRHFRWVRPYLRELTKTGNNTLACMAAKVSTNQVWRARQRSATFARACRQAMEAHADLILGEVERRAIQGHIEHLTFRGQKTWEWVDADGRPLPPNVDPSTIPGSRMAHSMISRKSDALLAELARAKLAGFARIAPEGATNINVGSVNVLQGKSLEEFKSLPVADMLAMLKG